MNMNNIISYELKKDQKVEIIESKKGIFSSTKKVTIKMNSHEDLEDWIIILDRLLKK